MESVNKSTGSHFAVEVLVPTDVASKERAEFEEGVVEFLFGPDRIRPELVAALKSSGVDTDKLEALYKVETVLATAVCPSPDDFAFVPGPELLKIAATNGVSFTGGGSVRVLFTYARPGDVKLPTDELHVRVHVPKGMASSLTPEATGELVQGLMGDCQLPKGVQQFLAAHKVELAELARRTGGKFQHGRVPPTTRVRPEVEKRLRDMGFDTAQFGQLKVVGVAETP
jgi:hypothetical protein